jgi:hypothetical protein
MLEPGEIMCRKTTGELVLIIEKSVPELASVQDHKEAVVVRRPVMTHNLGISHSLEVVYICELETMEEHLRREANEMIFKSKLQDEVMDELREYQESRQSKKKDVLVN